MREHENTGARESALTDLGESSRLAVLGGCVTIMGETMGGHVMHAIRLVTDGIPQETVNRGLRVLHRLGGGYTLQEGLGEKVTFMAPVGSIRGGIQTRLVGGVMARVYETDDGLHDIRMTMPRGRRVCVLEGLTAEQLPQGFHLVWNEVADKVA